MYEDDRFEKNRIERQRIREERKREEKRRKLKLKTFGGTLVIAASIATELFGTNLVKPLDAGYFFSSDDVKVTQSGDDYRSKNYEVRDVNGNTMHFTFDTLEQIEPNVHGGYTSVPSEYLPNGSHLNIQRTENNPVKAVIQGGALLAFLSGGMLTGESIYEQSEMKEDKRR